MTAACGHIWYGPLPVCRYCHREVSSCAGCERPYHGPGKCIDGLGIVDKAEAFKILVRS